MPNLDRHARREAARLIRELGEGRISNDEFDDAYPLSSSDRGIAAIYMYVWHFYDDLHEHRLEGEYLLQPEARRMFERCVAFLESEEAYEWPPLYSIPVIGRCLCFFVAKYRWGKPDAWPFQRQAEL